ncbi:hypothetical protein ACPXB3_10620 [Gordonia sp. DT219]|uniref:hypothetical protein n=1 Tax=Gordonia sp. DT219 TaxID=3416658 RepID=UPI003CED46A9
MTAAAATPYPPSRRASVPAGTALPVLVDGTAVLIRPDNRIHIGADPHTALVLELPARVSGRAVAALLGSLRTPRTRTEIFSDLVDTGLTRADLDTILDRLVAAGKALRPAPGSRTSTLRIRVHGTGPLTALLMSSLTDAGFGVTRSARRPMVPANAAAVSPLAIPNLVILADHLVHEPWMVERLMRTRTPHLQVRLRDGAGLIGPLVLPGLSSCLDCADRHRADRDSAWPVLAAQLVGATGHASTSIARATAALTHDQVEHLADALAEDGTVGPPHLVNRVLELRPQPSRLESTTWLPHPLCGCHEVTVPQRARPGHPPARPLS